MSVLSHDLIFAQIEEKVSPEEELESLSAEDDVVSQCSDDEKQNVYEEYFALKTEENNLDDIYLRNQVEMQRKRTKCLILNRIRPVLASYPQMAFDQQLFPITNLSQMGLLLNLIVGQIRFQTYTQYLGTECTFFYFYLLAIEPLFSYIFNVHFPGHSHPRLSRFSLTNMIDDIMLNLNNDRQIGDKVDLQHDIDQVVEDYLCRERYLNETADFISDHRKNTVLQDFYECQPHLLFDNKIVFIFQYLVLYMENLYYSECDIANLFIFQGDSSKIMLKYFFKLIIEHANDFIEGYEDDVCISILQEIDMMFNTKFLSKPSSPPFPKKSRSKNQSTFLARSLSFN